MKVHDDANFMPSIAKEYVSAVIYIKKDITMMYHLADVFLKGSAGEIFEELMKKIRE